MKVIVWLGNPGKKYENTRHNVGYMMVDLLQKKWGGSEWEESRFSGMISEYKTDIWESIIFLKPTTFMNLSGDAVANIVHYYKLDPSTDLIVISDDIDMEFGKVRKREKWSHGGQNGLRDIIAKLWTDQFTRIKIGIGRDERYQVADWVLSKFTKDEQGIIASEIYASVEKTLQAI
jgi:peptidyl-tRNA hydrolase, PTH1 family